MARNTRKNAPVQAPSAEVTPEVQAQVDDAVQAAIDAPVQEATAPLALLIRTADADSTSDADSTPTKTELMQRLENAVNAGQSVAVATVTLLDQYPELADSIGIVVNLYQTITGTGTAPKGKAKAAATGGGKRTGNRKYHLKPEEADLAELLQYRLDTYWAWDASKKAYQQANPGQLFALTEEGAMMQLAYRVAHKEYDAACIARGLVAGVTYLA